MRKLPAFIALVFFVFQTMSPAMAFVKGQSKQNGISAKDPYLSGSIQNLPDVQWGGEASNRCLPSHYDRDGRIAQNNSNHSENLYNVGFLNHKYLSHS